MTGMRELSRVAFDQGVGEQHFSHIDPETAATGNFFHSVKNENREGFFRLLAKSASNAMKGASRWLVDRARQL